MKKVLSLIALVNVFFYPIFCSEGEGFSGNSVYEIDKQMEIFKNLKIKHEKNRERHLRLAHRWQGNTDLFLESKREYNLAEGLLDKIHLLEIKIEKLEKKKQEVEKNENEIKP